MIKKDTTLEKKTNDSKAADPYFDVGQSWAQVKTIQDQELKGNKDWLEEGDYAGQLAVDVFQTKDEIVIKSTIAGVRPEDIDISINNDMITIRGKRDKDHEVADEDYFYRECYWGGFSRSIILPCEVKIDRIKATMKNGVLTIALPKATKVSRVTVVKVKEE
jgi:HSP20 family protein